MVNTLVTYLDQSAGIERKDILDKNPSATRKIFTLGVLYRFLREHRENLDCLLHEIDGLDVITSEHVDALLDGLHIVEQVRDQHLSATISENEFVSDFTRSVICDDELKKRLLSNVKPISSPVSELSVRSDVMTPETMFSWMRVDVQLAQFQCRMRVNDIFDPRIVIDDPSDMKELIRLIPQENQPSRIAVLDRLFETHSQRYADHHKQDDDLNLSLELLTDATTVQDKIYAKVTFLERILTIGRERIIRSR